MAVQAARTAPGQIATLILPSDTSWDEGGVVGAPLPVPAAPPADPHAVRNAARVLREKKNVLILLGGEAVHERVAAPGLAHRRGDRRRLMAEGSNARIAARPRPPAARARALPADQAVEALAPFEHIVLVNAKPPVGFFAYPGQAEPPVRGRRGAARAHARRAGAEAALQALVDELGAPPAAIPDPGPAGDRRAARRRPKAWPRPSPR